MIIEKALAVDPAQEKANGIYFVISIILSSLHFLAHPDVRVTHRPTNMDYNVGWVGC